jgi:acyl-coenzyme A synthetase/AMP-(fatty) acid ligase
MSVINSHLIQGATLLLTDKAVTQREFWTFLKEQRATSIAGVPYTYEMLKRLRFFRMDLPDLKTMIQAGGKLNADYVKEYVDYALPLGKRFIVMYGQTEAAPRMSYLPFDRAVEKNASIGIAIPGGKLLVVDADGRETIVSHFLGTKRVQMLILDSSAVVKNRNMFSARGAGILGFSMFGPTSPAVC